MEYVGKLDKNEGDWEWLLEFLPDNWNEKAKQLGALTRKRNFHSPESLLRSLLIHLVNGCSLRETVVRAKCGEIADVSDVALLKRLNASGEWFRWMAQELMNGCIEKTTFALFPDWLQIRLVDATCVSEPGSTGTDWRIHYAVDLPSLKCAEVKVTDCHTGETFKNFHSEKDILWVADRGYCHREGIHHIVKGDGYVLVRINLTNLPMLIENGVDSFIILEHLRLLTGNEIGDWPVKIKCGKDIISGRVCAIKKNRISAEKSRKKLIKEWSKKQKTLQPDTLEAAGYIFVFTTIQKKLMTATAVLEVYRGRWQVELVFKRLKSIIGAGHLPKQDKIGAKAWIHGKLFATFLIETLITAGERFFPWGYPITRRKI